MAVHCWKKTVLGCSTSAQFYGLQSFDGRPDEPEIEDRQLISKGNGRIEFWRVPITHIRQPTFSNSSSLVIKFLLMPPCTLHGKKGCCLHIGRRLVRIVESGQQAWMEVLDATCLLGFLLFVSWYILNTQIGTLLIRAVVSSTSLEILSSSPLSSSVCPPLPWTMPVHCVH